MKIQNTIFTFLLLFLSLVLNAQSKDLDIIYLKDGTRLKGTITNYEKDVYFEIEVENRVLRFEAEEIKRVINNSKNRNERVSTSSSSKLPEGVVLLDEVHLNDGSLIKGEITDLKRGEYVEITADGRVLRFEESDVRRIISAVPSVSETKTRKPKEKIDPAKLRTTGIYNTTYLSFSYGQNLEQNFSIGAGIHTVTGKQWSQKLGLGLGIGIDNYRPSRGETVYPLYLDYRYYPSKKNKAIYANLGAGYGFAFTNEARGIREANGGAYISPVIGFRSASKDGVSLNMELGYKYQRARFVEESNRTMNDIQIRDNQYQRIVFRLGLMFWGKKK